MVSKGRREVAGRGGKEAGGWARGHQGVGLPQEWPTYLAPGEQRGEAADGPQCQMHVLHQGGCVGRGTGDQRGLPSMSSAEHSGMLSWGRYLLC